MIDILKMIDEFDYVQVMRTKDCTDSIEIRAVKNLHYATLMVSNEMAEDAMPEITDYLIERLKTKLDKP